MLTQEQTAGYQDLTMPDSLPHCVKIHIIEAGLDTVLVYLPETAVYAHSLLLKVLVSFIFCQVLQLEL